jgi:hypothetical protein
VSQTQVMKIIDETAEPVSVKTAWQIFRGNRSADPTYLALMRAKQEFTSLDKILSEAGFKTDDGLPIAVRAVILMKQAAEDQIKELENRLNAAHDFIRVQADHSRHFLGDVPEEPVAVSIEQPAPDDDAEVTFDEHQTETHSG